MVTASHNPKAWTGVKMVREGALAFSGDAGIGDVRAEIEAGMPEAPGGGSVEQGEIYGDFHRHALSFIDPERVTGDYKAARRTEGDDELEAVLAQRFASVQRLFNALDDTDERLRLLDARLGATVAGAAEVALGTAGADTLDTDLDDVVGELESLRAALHELG